MAPGDETCISPWHKGVLIPFWVLQLLAILNALGICGAGIANSGTQYNYQEYEEDGDEFAVAYVIFL